MKSRIIKYFPLLILLTFLSNQLVAFGEYNSILEVVNNQKPQIELVINAVDVQLQSIDLETNENYNDVVFYNKNNYNAQKQVEAQKTLQVIKKYAFVHKEDLMYLPILYPVEENS